MSICYLMGSLSLSHFSVIFGNNIDVIIINKIVVYRCILLSRFLFSYLLYFFSFFSLLIFIRFLHNLFLMSLEENNQAPPKMATTMKGLLRGLRYITHIFEDKEQEMEIGFPTDVKHVAHIGMDGPSANSPSWMSGFKSVPELANEPSNSNGPVRNSAKNFVVEDVTRKAAAGIEDSQTRNANEKAKHKARRKPSTGTGSPISSPTRQGGTEGTKQPRRHTSSNNSADSANNQKTNVGAESSSNTRRKKTKGSTSGGSTKTSKSKGQNSSGDSFPSTENESGLELGQGTKNESQLSPISETKQEEKG
ncbi:hypothetical protein ACOSQ3_006889 [Xanthoceras sorbifolium]